MTYLKAGFLWGFVLVSIHALWAWIVSANYGQSLINFLLKVHFLSNPFIVQNFDLQVAFFLIFMSGIFGFISGASITYLLDYLSDDSCPHEED